MFRIFIALIKNNHHKEVLRFNLKKILNKYMFLLNLCFNKPGCVTVWFAFVVICISSKILVRRHPDVETEQFWKIKIENLCINWFIFMRRLIPWQNYSTIRSFWRKTVVHLSNCSRNLSMRNQMWAMSTQSNSPAPQDSSSSLTTGRRSEVTAALYPHHFKRNKSRIGMIAILILRKKWWQFPMAV